MNRFNTFTAGATPVVIRRSQNFASPTIRAISVRSSATARPPFRGAKQPAANVVRYGPQPGVANIFAIGVAHPAHLMPHHAGNGHGVQRLVGHRLKAVPKTIVASVPV